MDDPTEQPIATNSGLAGRIFLAVLLTAIVAVIAWSAFIAWRRQARGARVIQEMSILREYAQAMRAYAHSIGEPFVPTVAIATYTITPQSSKHVRMNPALYFRRALVGGKTVGEWAKLNAPLEDIQLRAATDPPRPEWESVGTGLFLREMAAFGDDSWTVIVGVFHHEGQQYPMFSAVRADGTVRHFYDVTGPDWRAEVESDAVDRTRLDLSPLPDVAAWFNSFVN